MSPFSLPLTSFIPIFVPRSCLISPMKGSVMTDTLANPTTSLPPVVSREEWETASAALLAKEKAHMKAGDALAAERRRLPMIEVSTDYTFDTPDGPKSLLDLFEGRSQLVVYHFMYGPNDTDACVGCSTEVDNLGDLSHLNARDISFVLISRAPLAKLEAWKTRMGWTQPWVSSFGTTFNEDFGATKGDEEDHGISVFLRDGATERIFLTYQQGGRGNELVLNHFQLMDLTPFGRQEDWEDSPEGWPQGPRYTWWRLHDRYAVDGIPAPSQTASSTATSNGEGCSCDHCH
jgi:predicted dithiol-disulfide oxidoreductase (DUF899 family)